MAKSKLNATLSEKLRDTIDLRVFEMSGGDKKYKVQQPLDRPVSFERPAYAFWTGFVTELITAYDFTPDEAEELVRSTFTRHFLDDGETKLDRLGARVAEAFVGWCGGERRLKATVAAWQEEEL